MSTQESDDRMQAALGGFDAALAALLPDVPADKRDALVGAVYVLVDALLSRVTVIVNEHRPRPAKAAQRRPRT